MKEIGDLKMSHSLKTVVTCSVPEYRGTRTMYNEMRIEAVCHKSGKVFASQERVSGFPRERADLRRSLGNFRGSPGNFRGSLGNFRGTPGLL